MAQATLLPTLGRQCPFLNPNARRSHLTRNSGGRSQQEVPSLQGTHPGHQVQLPLSGRLGCEGLAGRGEDKRVKEADTKEERRRRDQRRKREGSQEKIGG